MIVEKLLYTIEEAMAVVAVSRSRLYELLSTGDIVAVKAGKRMLVRAESLVAYVDSLPIAKINCNER